MAAPPSTLRLVLLGAGSALALGLPAALVAQVLDALAGDDGPPSLVLYLLTIVVLIGIGVGGWVVGRRATGRATLLGAASGLVAIAVVLALGIARRTVAGDEVAWATVPATAVLATLVAAGTARAARRAARTRP